MRVLVCVRVCLSVISHIVKPMQWPHSGGLSCVFACIFCLCEVTSNRNMILYFHIPLCFRMYLNLRFVVSMNRDPLKKRLRLQKPHLCSDMRVTNKLFYIYIFFNYFGTFLEFPGFTVHCITSVKKAFFFITAIFEKSFITHL